MQEKLKQQVMDAFLLILRPIVRILLRYSVSYREFSELLKTAFVDIASSDFGLRGRPTNISRVAVMTGLTRKEVKRIRDLIAKGERSIAVKTTPISDVLHHWHAQPEYTNSNGEPLCLPFNGGDISFCGLVRRYGGDVPGGAMRTEMLRVGVISQDEKGNLSVLSRAVRPDSDHQRLITMLVHGAYAYMSNVVHNTDPNSPEPKWASRIAHTTALDNSESGQLRRITKDRITEFAESIDDVFMAYESLHPRSEEGGKSSPVAVGVFYFEE
ncbi:MAG: DUF6502 family protein, partial [Gammaproteobacteria bacterium]|nr:DUF6502 family protein [Gammaproteobacteria bacterium]